MLSKEYFPAVGEIATNNTTDTKLIVKNFILRITILKISTYGICTRSPPPYPWNNGSTYTGGRATAAETAVIPDGDSECIL
jgi:hypothetical protein